MSPSRMSRKGVAAVAAVGALALGGSAVAGAASSTSTTSTSGSAPAAAQGYGAPSGAKPSGPHTVNGKSEKLLTGDTEAKVKAAALAKVPGTVERVETNVDGSAPYEAHITKSDGSQVEVQVNSDYTVAAVNGR
jgi:hypothetical protein